MSLIENIYPVMTTTAIPDSYAQSKKPKEDPHLLMVAEYLRGVPPTNTTHQVNVIDATLSPVLHKKNHPRNTVTATSTTTTTTNNKMSMLTTIKSDPTKKTGEDTQQMYIKLVGSTTGGGGYSSESSSESSASSSDSEDKTDSESDTSSDDDDDDDEKEEGVKDYERKQTQSNIEGDQHDPIGASVLSEKIDELLKKAAEVKQKVKQSKLVEKFNELKEKAKANAKKIIPFVTGNKNTTTEVNNATPMMTNTNIQSKVDQQKVDDKKIAPDSRSGLPTETITMIRKGLEKTHKSLMHLLGVLQYVITLSVEDEKRFKIQLSSLVVRDNAKDYKSGELSKSIIHLLEKMILPFYILPYLGKTPQNAKKMAPGSEEEVVYKQYKNVMKSHFAHIHSMTYDFDSKIAMFAKMLHQNLFTQKEVEEPTEFFTGVFKVFRQGAEKYVELLKNPHLDAPPKEVKK